MGGFINRVSNSPTEANYGGHSHWIGARFTAIAGATTPYDYELPVDLKLFSGTFWVNSDATIGDMISFAVVDVNGIVSPPGTVIREYVDDIYVVPDERRMLQSGQASDLAAGLFLRTTYASTGATNVEVLMDWQYFEAP
jgi:hypothetical protein